jgi:DNA-binding Lrp family transcriptional regulator
MIITETDKNIILEFQNKGRATYAELSSRLGYSSSTIARRIDKLIASETITVRALPNPYRMGLEANALIAITCAPSKADDVCAQLKNNIFVNNIHTIFGRIDILSIVYFPSWELLHRFINKELFSIEGVEQADTYYIKDIKKRYQGLFEKLQPVKPSDIKPIDQQLIEALVKDGRVPVNELARKLDSNVSTISRRISSLLKKDIIKICAVPNPAKLGYSSNATIVLDVEAHRIDEICRVLYDVPQLHTIMTLIQGNGIVVGIHAKDNESLYQLIKKRVSCIKGVKRTETFIRAEIKKRYYGWFMENEDDYSKRIEGNIV